MTGRQVQQEIQTSKLWRCRAWAVIGLLPVLAWITMFVWSLFIYNQPINTGDKLQDRYLTELASMAEHLMFQDSMSSPHWVSSKPVGYIPDLVLAAIEAEFADDPRYWMLRFHNTYSGGFYAQSRNPDQISRRDVLELARDQGVVNGPILLSLLKSYESEWKETAAREVPPPQNPLTFSPAQNRADIWAVVDEQHCVEHRQLAAELLAAAPDEAQAYYHLALVEADRGNNNRAMEYFAQGNAAPLNSGLRGFPNSIRFSELGAGGVNDDLLIGGLIGYCSFTNASELLDIKKTTKHLVAQAIADNDLELLSELHRFACRTQAHDEALVVNLLIGLDLVELIHQAYLGLNPGPVTPEQQASLNELDQRLSELNSEIKLRCRPPIWLRGLHLSRDQTKVLEKFWDLASFGQSSTWLFFEEYHYDFKDKNRAHELGFADQLAEIARFNYSALSWDNDAATIP